MSNIDDKQSITPPSSCNENVVEPLQSKTLELCDIVTNPIEASVPFTMDNPYHPYHWNWKKKYAITVVYCLLQIFITLTSTTYVAVEYMVQERFNVNVQVATLGQSMFIIGDAVGPAFLGPLSDLAGRKWVYVFSIILYVIFNFGCAWPLNMPMLAIFMLIIGTFGSTALSNVAGTIGDMFGSSDEASQPMALFVFAANAGPSIGGIVGEAIAENSKLGYKWIFIINIIIGSVFVLLLLLVPETLPRIVIQEQTAMEGKETRHVILREIGYLKEILTFKKPSYQVIYEEKMTASGDNAVVVEKTNVLNEIKFVSSQALKMMVTEPIIAFMGLYNGFAYGLMFLYLDGIFDVFVYNNGLSYMGAEATFLNFVVGGAFVIVLQPIQTWLFRRDRLRNDGVSRPEARFLMSLVTVWGFPLGLFWFAFTSDGSVNYWSPIVAGCIVGIADPLLWLAMLNYIIDSYSAASLSNSAIAAFCIPSFGIGAALAHAGVKMFASMSTTWAMATLGFISIGIVALVYILYFFGEKLRRASKVARFSIVEKS